MPVLVLKKLDKNDFTKDFDVGEHIIGRGPLLSCESKKVSRKHGMLRVTETEGVFFHAIHNNPCFYQSCNTTEIRIITFGKNVQINNDDKIALALDHGWFKVQITTDSLENVINKNTSHVTDSVKRGIVEDNEEESPAKKLKMNDNDSNNTTVPCNETIPANNELEREIKIEPVEEDAAQETSVALNSDGQQIKIKKEIISNEDIDTSPKLLKVKEEKLDENDCPKTDDGGSKAVEVEKEKVGDDKKIDDADKNADQPSTSSSASNVWKDRCWYGSSCYRKNPVHRSQFRHPGDADYDSDPNDTRPVCSYGKDCYRKNKEHRKRLRHAGQTSIGKPPPQKSKPPSPYGLRVVMHYDDDDDDDDDDEDTDFDFGLDVERMVVNLGDDYNANDSGVSISSDDSDVSALWSRLWRQ